MIEEILASLKKKKHWNSKQCDNTYFLSWRRPYGLEQTFSLEFLKIFVYIVSSPDTVSLSN
jgi:hypothetical protein